MSADRRYTRHDAAAPFEVDRDKRAVQEYADVMYTLYGRVSHVVPFGQRDVFPGTGGAALCGADPWLGTGDQGEWNRARRQPLCIRCMRIAQYRGWMATP